MVTLVVPPRGRDKATKGSASMDAYAQEISEHAAVSLLYSDIYQQTAERFNVSWLSMETARAIWKNSQFVTAINKLEGTVHLPNHHLGRMATS